MTFLQKNMWKILPMLAVLLFLSDGLMGQAGYVFIGQGGTGNTGATTVSPINPNTRNFRYQVLYTKAEIEAAGGIAGNITRLAWNVHQTASGMQNYTIKMGHTTVTSLSVHNSSATTQVYTTASYNASLGLNDITFTTPFNWNGSQNIIVEVCYSRASTSTSGGSVYTTTGTSPTNRYITNTTATPSVCSTNTNNNNFSTKPQVRFYMNMAASCAAPTNLQVTGVTGTTAGFSWTAGSPSVGYYYLVNQSATAPVIAGTAGTGTTLTVNSGLTAGTSYYFWIRNRCTTTSNSDWISIPFTTTCAAPSLTTTGGSRCGAGSVSLSASPSAGTVYWWDAATGGNLLGTGNTFNTPSISSTTTYYASAGQAMSGNNTGTLGTGAKTSSTTFDSPLHSATPYNGQSVNYIIRASELLEAGIGAGYITSLGLDVVTAGGALNTFYIKVGTTAANDLSSGYETGSLNYYYGNNISGVTYQPTAGINTFNFSGSGFYWDGSSNISILFYWQNSSSPGSESKVKYDDMNYVATRFQSLISSSWGSQYTVSQRPKMLINGKGLCMSSRVSAVATINSGSYTYYKDNDGDGFGDPNNSISSCDTTPPVGYVSNNSDCNDNLLTYLDNDGDGNGSATPAPCGVSNNTDCNDNDNTVWLSASLYIDNDGDGYTNGSEVVCYGASIPVGYSATSLGTDCNDNNPNINPGATEICGNGIDDNCDGQVDEGCPAVQAPANNNPTSGSGLLTSPNYVYPNCYLINGTTLGATVSEYTGEKDVWYRFTAYSNGVSMKVSSSTMDAKIYLFDSADLSTPLKVVNQIQGGGTEILNYDGLTAGHLYRIAVTPADGIAGNFTICLQQLRLPVCDKTGTIGLCDLFKIKPTGATNINVSFTDDNENTVSTTTSTFVTLSQESLGLRPGWNYDVSLVANYNALVDGLGNPEPIQIANPEVCSITIAPHAPVVLRAADRCSNLANLARNAYIYGTASNSCGANGYKVEFVEMSACDGETIGLPFEKTVLGSLPRISLNYVFNAAEFNGLTGVGYWRVRWKPRFGSGYYGTYSDAYVIGVNATAPGVGMITEQGDISSSLTTGENISANIYPNPNNGDMVNINVTGVNGNDVYVRIMDAMGREVYQNHFEAEGSLNTIVSFSKPLASGLYMVEFRSGDNIITQRMMVSK